MWCSVAVVQGDAYCSSSVHARYLNLAMAMTFKYPLILFCSYKPMSLTFPFISK